MTAFELNNPRRNCTYRLRRATSGTPSHLDVWSARPRRPIGHDRPSGGWLSDVRRTQTTTRFTLDDVTQSERADKWLQALADAALWLLFRLVRVRS